MLNSLVNNSTTTKISAYGEASWIDAQRASGSARRPAAVCAPGCTIPPALSASVGLMAAPVAAAWRAVFGRGLAELSPPEAAHTLLELPANRPEYVGLLQDMGDWPDRSPIGQRLPADAEVDALDHLAGRWRAVTLLDDERALRISALAFSRTFVLDPLYDNGDLLYAAWHDPAVSAEHAQRLAAQASLLVRAAPLLRSSCAVLTPDHLPGSWDPRPGWRPRLPHPNPSVEAAWWLRTALVLLYWADRLEGVVCTTQPGIVAALRLALGPGADEVPAKLAEAPSIEAAQAAREQALRECRSHWARTRRLSRHRSPRYLRRLGCALERIHPDAEQHTRWQLMLGPPQLPDPALLIRRVLNAQDPGREPPLPPKPLRRRPLCLVPFTTASAAPARRPATPQPDQ